MCEEETVDLASWINMTSSPADSVQAEVHLLVNVDLMNTKVSASNHQQPPDYQPSPSQDIDLSTLFSMWENSPECVHLNTISQSPEVSSISSDSVEGSVSGTPDVLQDGPLSAVAEWPAVQEQQLSALTTVELSDPEKPGNIDQEEELFYSDAGELIDNIVLDDQLMTLDQLSDIHHYIPIPDEIVFSGDEEALSTESLLDHTFMDLADFAGSSSRDDLTMSTQHQQSNCSTADHQCAITQSESVPDSFIDACNFLTQSIVPPSSSIEDSSDGLYCDVNSYSLLNAHKGLQHVLPNHCYPFEMSISEILPLTPSDTDFSISEEQSFSFPSIPPSFPPLSTPSPSSFASADKTEDNFSCLWSGCGKQLPSCLQLVQHVQSTHIDTVQGRQYTCLWRNCPRMQRPFNAKYKLLIHCRIHSGEKPNICSCCGKAFSRRENLKIHTRSHTGERPYNCKHPGCSKSFSNSSDRAKHQRTHKHAKPYICPEPSCRRRYTDPSSLRKHIKLHTSTRCGTSGC